MGLNAQNYYSREWSQNGYLDVNNDGISDFYTNSDGISSLRSNALLGVFTANTSKIKYLRFNDVVGPNNTNLSWARLDNNNYFYDSNALSISETQSRTYPLTGENYYFVANNTSFNVVYSFKVGDRYGFFVFVKINGGYAVRYSAITTIDNANISVDPNNWNSTINISENTISENITIKQYDNQLNVNHDAQIKTITLLDMNGKQILSNNDTTTINTSGIAKGFYILNVTDEKLRNYRKQIVIN